MKKRYIFLLIFLILFTSCSTLFVDDEEGLPQWISAPKIKVGSIGYVVKGSGNTEEDAKSDAAGNLLKEMSADIGWDAYSIYYRELTTDGTVADLGGAVEKNYSRQKDGIWTHWMLFIADSETFDSARTEEKRDYFLREETIEARVAEASQFYRENRDTDALSAVLDALLLSLEGPTDGFKYDSDELFELALRYLEPLELRIDRKGNGTNSEIRVIRYKGLFSPTVKDAPVVFHYERTNTTGGIVRDSVSSVTNEKGSYVFTNTDPFIRRTGTISVSIALNYEILYRIEELAGHEFFAPFWEMLGTKTMSYEYDTRKDVAIAGSMDILIAQYGKTGKETEGPAVDSFIDSFEEDGIILDVYRGRGESDTEIRLNFRATDGKTRKKYTTVIRMGIVEDAAVLDSLAAKVEGSITVYENKTGNVVLSDTNLQAIGYGKSADEAETKALDAAGRIAADIIRTLML